MALRCYPGTRRTAPRVIALLMQCTRSSRGAARTHLTAQTFVSRPTRSALDVNAPESRLRAAIVRASIRASPSTAPSADDALNH